MTLAALICAYQESDEPGDGLRATLPLAGRTLLERQARLAASIGARPVVLLVERMPPELLAAIDRLRAEGIAITIARTASDAGEAVHPEDRLLLIADGLVTDDSQINRLLTAEGDVLLTVTDADADDRFERIDAHCRWAGLAILKGGLLKQTAAMLQDWDLQSTLLRRAVQGGARPMACGGANGRPTIAERTADLAEAEARIMEASGARRDDWASRFLLAPAEMAMTRLLMPTSIAPEWLNRGAALLTGLAVALFAADWLWAGSLLMLLASPVEGVARQLGGLRLQRVDEQSWARQTLPILATAALVALAWSLARSSGWGCLALAAATIAFLLALHKEAAGMEVEGRLFLAERKGLIWLMLPFAATGLWVSGLTLLALYAAGSFFWVQHQRHGAAGTGCPILPQAGPSPSQD